MYCGKCGAEISDTDTYCGKCGAVQKRPYVQRPTSSVGSSRTRMLAAATITLLVLAGLFGSGLIQQLLSKSPLSLPSQSTGTSTVVTTSRVSAETSNIASIAETSSSASSFMVAPSSVFSSLPNSPTAVGCYDYGQAGFANATCLSSEEVLKYGHLPGHFLGIGSNNAGNPSGHPTLLTYGLVMVNIHNFGSEWDSSLRDGAYSIQLNTNTFFGNNGHTDWVQFVYQDYCGFHGGVVGYSCEDRSRLCIWNVDITIAKQTKNQDGYYPTCVGPGDVPLSKKDPSPWETVIVGFVRANGNLELVAFLDGHIFNVVAPDTYGLAFGWSEASGGIMGAGGSSVANFQDTLLQTDIGVNSCPNQVNGGASLWRDCGGQPISADDYVREADTGESSALTQYDESMTSYYSYTHWWISSASGCNPAFGQDIHGPGCTQFVNYGEALGPDRNMMLFTVNVDPTGGGVHPGYDLSATVDVISVNGVQVGPITMHVDGLSSLGTEDLSGQTCGFSLPLQPGSRCISTMNIHTLATASSGTYDLSITGTPPPNAVPPASGGLPQLSNTAGYQLIIEPSVAPLPTIVSPVYGASLNAGDNTLIGYAHSTDTSELGWVPCSHMQFQVTLSDGSTVIANPTEDSTYQQTGYCDATVGLTFLGPATVTLSAANLAGVKGTTSVGVNIVSSQQPTPFTFTLSVTPSSYAIDRGGQGSFIVTVIATGGTPEPVLLSVSGLPQGVTYTLSSNTVTPTATLTLTINSSADTPLGTYPISITGTLIGGSTASTTLQLTVASLG
ncbi:MAG: zinc-ribbon domain-containing protein [Candidatus Bathyarchaeia archaeon]